MKAHSQNRSDATSTQQVSPCDLRGLIPSASLDKETPELILPATYETLVQEFQNLCINCGDKDYQALEKEHFPSIMQIDMLLHLFYDRFIPPLPISHHITRNVNEFWLLTLAMSAIGCQYTRTQEFESMVAPLHQFLRRGLQREMNLSQKDPQAQIYYLKAFLLSQISHFYYGDVEMRRQAMIHRGLLIQLAEASGLFAAETRRGHDESEAPDHDAHNRWQQWIRLETKRRLGYSIWMLDLMVFYHFDIPPLMSYRVPEADLPHDGLWTAPNEHEWLELFERTRRNPPLPNAIKSIFLRKKVKPDLGEFGRILLLHGIYHEIFQVKAYFQRPLSNWIPTAQLEPTVSDLASSPGSSIELFGSKQWLAETATFAAWRNAALDCVDELHWWANGVIALQSGTEHPTVHHLHFSRVVLLVPVKEILTLLLSITKDAGDITHQTTTANVYMAEQEVIRWAHRDESKARLAAIHCGCVFWHLRRFSNMAFYETQSVFHATLALWAYSYYSSQTAMPRPEEPDHMSEDEDHQGTCAASLEEESNDLDIDGIENPEFIWLDRPNDDEMVQYFVRSGRPVNMKAYVSGVGDIYEPKSPAKILRHGLRILESVAFAWGRDRDYVNILQKAERVMLGRGS
ncbi:unnamed protein product [Clonostachys rosea]|uniref:Xylanolytic transcriptional activator regulatory domain-containing protein n=1 Tax=Bionectria ochroleuca TaxID=29856 RepID=A0ABY6TVQ5_BIOOC|nr:unnamed protein product [Clonostachys rosea]